MVPTVSFGAPSTPWAVGIALLIAVTSWRRKSLRPSGAIAATVVGALALRAGYTWGAFLVLWFVWVTTWSRLGRARKALRTAGVVEKGAERDASQVLANGGVFALAATIVCTTGDLNGSAALWGASALAAAGADTVATEIGTWVGAAPRSVRTWRIVPPGTSGAVSAAGSVAMGGSALVLATLAVALGVVPAGQWWVVAVAAVVGAVMDTVVGALVQARRWCPVCEAATEQRRHWCGATTEPRGGWPWLGNDAVNVVCTASAAAVAWLLA
jgi:uncharacterized protein (TIGR00297 family)